MTMKVKEGENDQISVESERRDTLESQNIKAYVHDGVGYL